MGTRLTAVSVGVEVTVVGVNEAPALATDAGKSGMALSERGTDNGTDVADVVWEAPLNEGPGRKAAAIAAATSSRSSARTAASDIAVNASDPGSAEPDVGAGGGSLSAISMNKIGYRKRNA